MDMVPADLICLAEYIKKEYLAPLSLAVIQQEDRKRIELATFITENIVSIEMLNMLPIVIDEFMPKLVQHSRD